VKVPRKIPHRPQRSQSRRAFGLEIHAQPGKTYFHLDEVEAYTVGSAQNVALGKPATQSSVSQWSAKHRTPGLKSPREYLQMLATSAAPHQRKRPQLSSFPGPFLE
jgi:hypothetical protein